MNGPPENQYECVGNLVFEMPWFIHDFGDDAHHVSMMRTAKLGKYGYIPGTGVPEWRFIIHEILDDHIFYPVNNYLRRCFGDGEAYQFLRSVLGFFWGLNCNFPFRDVVLYTAWDFHGCPAVKVWPTEEFEKALAFKRQNLEN